MNYSPETRSVLEELERRKEAKEDPCDSCDGSGAAGSDYRPLVCVHCFGQGVLLSQPEYRILMEIAITPDDILNAEILY